MSNATGQNPGYQTVLSVGGESLLAITFRTLGLPVTVSIHKELSSTNVMLLSQLPALMKGR